MPDRTKEEWIDVIVRSFGVQHEGHASEVAAGSIIDSLTNRAKERICRALCISCASSIPVYKEDGVWVHRDEIIYNCDAEEIREIDLK